MSRWISGPFFRRHGIWGIPRAQTRSRGQHARRPAARFPSLEPVRAEDAGYRHVPDDGQVWAVPEKKLRRSHVSRFVFRMR